MDPLLACSTFFAEKSGLYYSINSMIKLSTAKVILHQRISTHFRNRGWHNIYIMYKINLKSNSSKYY